MVTVDLCMTEVPSLIGMASGFKQIQFMNICAVLV